MTEFGKTPYYSAKEFEQFGYSMVVYPVTSLRAVSIAVEEVYKEIRTKGTQKDFLKRMQLRKEHNETISYFGF